MIKRLVVAVLAAPALATGCTPAEDLPTPVVLEPPTTSSPAGLAPATVETGLDGEPAHVARVVDGDTFELTNGDTVRPIGIDSCEDTGADATPGGADATSEAVRLLQAESGGRVVLLREPAAPNRDRYGRLLRYVELDDGRDFGEVMVQYDHTGIYTDSKGRQGGDASPEYLERLRANDLVFAANPPSGRECGSYPPPVSSGSNDGDDDVYIDLPDNDDDHRESWFCRKRRWC